MPPAPNIRIAPTLQEWAAEAATSVCEAGRRAVQSTSRFFLALAGGTTPERLYQTLAAPPFANQFDWSTATFFFGDERCVPLDHPESNFGMAQRALFSPLGIKPANIHRMKGENLDPETAAQDYEREIRTITHCSSPDFPQLDLILLGLGDDGHTASLFPGTAARQDKTHVVTVSQSPKGIATRLTLTLGVINRASMVLFLVTGSQKAPIVKRVLEPASEADRRLPAALVKPEQGQLVWLLDESAAGMLTRGR